MAIDFGRCVACGAYDSSLHEHHLVPRSRGGHDKPTVMLCVPCHGQVHETEWASNHIELTKAGLARAKASGKKLGMSNPSRTDTRTVSALGVAANKAEADRHAANLLPLIKSLQAQGANSLRAVAAELNARDVKTVRGGAWHATTVKNVLDRQSPAMAA
jgi:Recombinase